MNINRSELRIFHIKLNSFRCFNVNSTRKQNDPDKAQYREDGMRAKMLDEIFYMWRHGCLLFNWFFMIRQRNCSISHSIYHINSELACHFIDRINISTTHFHLFRVYGMEYLWQIEKLNRYDILHTIKHCIEIRWNRGQDHSMCVYLLAAHFQDDITQLGQLKMITRIKIEFFLEILTCFYKSFLWKSSIERRKASKKKVSIVF